MADPDSIMQLGVEAARKGEKDEARRLFRLLTREYPENTQAWLWLAGVAENREERQAALEQVLRLDPTNDMALKGLQALGVTPKPAAPPAPVTPPPAPAPTAPPATSVPDFDDDDPFAQLDALSEVMATDSGPVRRESPVSQPESTPGDAGVEERRAPQSPPPRASRQSEPSPTRSRQPSTSWARGSGKPARPTKPARGGGFSLGNLFRRSGPPTSGDDLADETVPAKRGLTPLTLILLGVLLVACIGIGFIFLSQRNRAATVPPNQATSQAATISAATAEASLAPTTPPTPAPEPTATQGEEPTPEPT
ncbi:hypothetical protein, partial [uncultured Chloroflexus sp.]